MLLIMLAIAGPIHLHDREDVGLAIPPTSAGLSYWFFPENQAMVSVSLQALHTYSVGA